MREGFPPEGSPQPQSDPELSLQEVNSPVHSTPSTPEGQAAAKRARADSSESDEHADDNVPSTSEAGATSHSYSTAVNFVSVQF